MRIFHMFGLEDKKIITGGCCVEGKVTEVNTCHWLKVNTKPVRTNPLDGARFPHVIHFRYCVDGKEFTGSRYVNWNIRCPVKDEIITVYYDSENPSKYAVPV